MSVFAYILFRTPPIVTRCPLCTCLGNSFPVCIPTCERGASARRGGRAPTNLPAAIRATMEAEYLNVDGRRVLHAIVRMQADGACLFRALSYLVYGTQDQAMRVRLQTVNHVAANWAAFDVITDDDDGRCYESPREYCTTMADPNKSGGISELLAAGAIYDHLFEVYSEGELVGRFGEAGRPVRRLRFEQDHGGGHYDVYRELRELPGGGRRQQQQQQPDSSSSQR